MHRFTFPQLYLNLTTNFLKWLIMWIVKYSSCVPTTTSYVSSNTRTLPKITKWTKSNNGLRQPARDFIKHVRFRKFSQVIILAYIFSYTRVIFLKIWFRWFWKNLDWIFLFMLFVDTWLTALFITHFIFVKHL